MTAQERRLIQQLPGIDAQEDDVKLFWVNYYSGAKSFARLFLNRLSLDRRS